MQILSELTLLYTIYKMYCVYQIGKSTLNLSTYKREFHIDFKVNINNNNVEYT